MAEILPYRKHFSWRKNGRREERGMRDRLIELISRVQYMGGLECKLADHLLSEGVIVPPCKVGDKAFFVHEMCDENGKEGYTISEGEVHGISKDRSGIWVFCRYDSGLTYYHTADDFGKEVFLMRMGAEKALKERSEQ
jgi:hypothetical protein